MKPVQNWHSEFLDISIAAMAARLHSFTNKLPGTADVETVLIGLENRLAQTLFYFLSLLVCI